MSNRSEFPEGVEVHQQALEFEATAVDSQTRERWVDAGVGGVASGLTVSVNVGNPTLVDIASGSGYAPNNERIEVAGAISGVGLSNYGAGVINLVSLVYTETSSRPEAHAFDGQTRTTRVTGTYRVRVFTQTEYDALPTSDDDLSVDAQDRTLVVATVNPNGIATPLVTADITLPPAMSSTVVGIDQPTNVTGVVITAIDATTPLSADVTPPNELGTLSYSSGATPLTTAALRWRAPGDTVLGAAVVVAGGGTFTLASDNGQTLTVFVYENLVIKNALTTVTDDLEVFDVYFNAAQRFSAADHVHRARLGSMMPNRSNPHGDRVSDLDDQIVDAGQGVVLGTDLQTDTNKSLTPRIVAAHTAFGGGRTLMWETSISGGTARIRMYANSFRTWEFIHNARWNGTTWEKDNTAASSAKFAIFDSGYACFARTASDPANFDDTSWTSIPVFMSGLAGGTEQGEFNLNGAARIGGLLLGSLAGRDIRRVGIDYDTPGGGGQVRTLLFEQHRNGASGDARILRIYRANSNGDGDIDVLEFTMNALWDTAGNQWVKDLAGNSASKYSYSRNFAGYIQRLAASASPFTDVTGAGGWDSPGITFGITSGAIVGNGGMFTGTQFFYGAGAQTYRLSLTPADAVGIGSNFTYSPNGGFLSPEGGFLSVNMGAGGTDQNVWWPIELPQGAIITGASLHFTSSNDNGASTIVAAVIRQPFITGNSESLRAGGTPYNAIPTGGNASYALTIDEVAGVRTIDNSQYTYALVLNAQGVGTTAYVCRGATITFTLAQVSA